MKPHQYVVMTRLEAEHTLERRSGAPEEIQLSYAVLLYDNEGKQPIMVAQFCLYSNALEFVDIQNSKYGVYDA